MRTVAIFVLALGCGVEGPAGPAGEDGIDGIDGVDGLDGTDNHITNAIFCTAQLATTTLQFNYSASLMAAGDIFASGAVYGTALQTGASSYYAAGQNGASTAPVFFTADVAGTTNGGWWRLELNRSTLVTVITYNDVDVSDSQDVWTMPSSACVLTSF